MRVYLAVNEEENVLVSTVELYRFFVWGFGFIYILHLYQSLSYFEKGTAQTEEVEKLIGVQNGNI